MQFWAKHGVILFCWNMFLYRLAWFPPLSLVPTFFMLLIWGRSTGSFPKTALCSSHCQYISMKWLTFNPQCRFLVWTACSSFLLWLTTNCILSGLTPTNHSTTRPLTCLGWEVHCSSLVSCCKNTTHWLQSVHNRAMAWTRKKENTNWMDGFQIVSQPN